MKLFFYRAVYTYVTCKTEEIIIKIRDKRYAFLLGSSIRADLMPALASSSISSPLLCS